MRVECTYINILSSWRLFFLLCVVIIVSSCKGVQKEIKLYENDFEKGTENNIANSKIEEYNGSKVLGRYSEQGFLLQLKDIPQHNMIKISFDLYIHDTWDGNALSPNGPDIWIMNIDNWSVIYATIANGLCTNCTQSYPVASPTIVNGKPVFYNYNPNANAIKTDLPGACALKDKKGGTSMYKIVKVFNHTASTLDIGGFAELKDPADPATKNCNESWSVDNMEVKAIIFK